MNEGNETSQNKSTCAGTDLHMDLEPSLKIELEVRRILDQEVSAHREFMERHFKVLSTGIATIAAVGFGIAVFLLGRSILETEKNLVREIDRAVVEYRLDEDLRSRIKLISEQIANGPDFQKVLDTALKDRSTALASEELSARIEEALLSQLQAIESSDLQDLIDRVIAGRVVEIENSLYSLELSVFDMKCKQLDGQLDLARLQCVESNGSIHYFRAQDNPRNLTRSE